MKKLYNLAYIPENSLDFIKYAHHLSATRPSQTYHIGTNSFPHITLCHFEHNEREISPLWTHLAPLLPQSLQLTFRSHRSKSYDGHPKWGGVSWISLIPNHLENLKRIHNTCVKIITNPLNLSFDVYDPHLTLFNSTTVEKCIPLNHQEPMTTVITDHFNLALGDLDDVGQITRVLFM